MMLGIRFVAAATPRCNRAMVILRVKRCGPLTEGGCLRNGHGFLSCQSALQGLIERRFGLLIVSLRNASLLKLDFQLEQLFLQRFENHLRAIRRRDSWSSRRGTHWSRPDFNSVTDLVCFNRTRGRALRS